MERDDFLRCIKEELEYISSNIDDLSRYVSVDGTLVHTGKIVSLEIKMPITTPPASRAHCNEHTLNQLVPMSIGDKVS